MDYFKQTIAWLTDLIFPARCIGCNKFGHAYSPRYSYGEAGRQAGDGHNQNWLCKSCRAKIKIASTSACIGCNQSSPRGDTCLSCCRENAIDRIIAAGNYADPILRNLITTLKYRFVPSLAEQCLVLIERPLRDMHQSKGVNIFENNPVIVPVPLHPYRFNWRGFNQAELIGHLVANTYQVHILNALSRNRRTDPQANIDDPIERAQNIADAFHCPDPSLVSEHDIILVDDVCTSGATLNACAKVLKSSGARKITALVVARG